jgi:hypothetical protein
VVVMLAMGMSLRQIKQTILMGVEGSFQPADEKERLVAWFRRELAL